MKHLSKNSALPHGKNLFLGENKDPLPIDEQIAKGGFFKVKSRFLLFSGFLSVALGIIGIFLPLLPTTPFILLGGFCFARSSRRWHQWLVTHPVFGGYIKAFSEKRGFTRSQKYQIALSSTIMWSITTLFAPMPLAIWIVTLIWCVLMAFLILSQSADDAPVSKKPFG